MTIWKKPMNISRFLSKAIGIYLMIVSMSVLFRRHEMVSFMNELINDAPLMFYLGFVTLILGILMVVSHNTWEWSWRTVITAISWIVLIKGVSILFFPQYMNDITLFFISHANSLYISASIDLALGLFLVYHGFKRA